MRNYFTAEETRNALQITQRTLYNLIKRKEIQAEKHGKEWRICPTSLRAYANLKYNVNE